MAVAAAYGWEWPLEDDDVLKRLFELNQSRAPARKTNQGTEAAKAVDGTLDV